MYTLHGAATSPFVRKAWIFLKEKGLDFEHGQLDPLIKSERFLAMNPMGRIPVLEIADGQFVSDSSVICDYLERVHPSPALYPEAPHRPGTRAVAGRVRGYRHYHGVRPHILDVYHHSNTIGKFSES